jgi:hypothetical protein
MISERSFEGCKLLTQHFGRSDFVAFQVSGSKVFAEIFTSFIYPCRCSGRSPVSRSQSESRSKDDEWQAVVHITFQLR